MEIYEAIKEIRQQKSINQQVIADALHLDVAVVSNIEKGKRDLRVKELEIISKVFEMSVVDLFTYPDRYVKLTQKEDEQVEAVLQIKLRKDKKDQVLKLVFGDNNIEIFNK
ncbi:MAG: helix-turn-helix domain-containing protein [Prevotella sp.]|nr:helix-turn-helix domain-containing protein [Prevotella sp.]